MSTRQASAAQGRGKARHALDARAATVVLQSFLDAGAVLAADPPELQQVGGGPESNVPE
ncbi:MAG: hypothetical protein AB7I09_00235 [Planctomycetota bacterium]